MVAAGDHAAATKPEDVRQASGHQQASEEQGEGKHRARREGKEEERGRSGAEREREKGNGKKAMKGLVPTADKTINKPSAAQSKSSVRRKAEPRVTTREASDDRTERRTRSYG